jgi:REP element-mobilizing transposase RayT
MNPERQRRWRRSIRLHGYDYSSAGAYFVTICTRHRQCILGEVEDGEVRLAETGRLVGSTWDALPTYYPGVALDAFVIMPNHVHGIILLEPGIVGAPFMAPQPPHDGDPVDSRWPRSDSTLTLGAIVRGFKARVTVARNRLRATPGNRIWQRNYHERVIRNDAELDRIRQYIADNPSRWSTDRDNPHALSFASPEAWEVTP